MVLNSTRIAGGIIAAALFGLGGAAQAQTFTYANTTTPQAFTGTNGASITLQDRGGTLTRNTNGTSTADIIIFNLTNASTNAAANAGTINATNYSTLISFTSGSQTLTQTLTGTFSGANVSQTTGDYTNTFTSASPLTFNFSNGNSVSLANFTFTAPPGVNSGFGAVGATATLNVVTASAPEPGSLALLGTGALALGGIAVRRRKK